MHVSYLLALPLKSNVGWPPEFFFPKSSNIVAETVSATAAKCSTTSWLVLSWSYPLLVELVPVDIAPEHGNWYGWRYLNGQHIHISAKMVKCNWPRANIMKNSVSLLAKRHKSHSYLLLHCQLDIWLIPCNMIESTSDDCLQFLH